MKLKNKVMLAFLLYIIAPFLIVGWVSSRQASEMTVYQVSETMLQLNVHNHTALERSLRSINEKTLKFIEEYFSFRYRPPIDLNEIRSISEYNAIDNLISNYPLDGSEYAVVVPLPAERNGFMLDKSKRAGLIYFEQGEEPPYFEEAVRLRGTGVLKILSSPGRKPTAAYIRALVDPNDTSQVWGVLYVTRLENILLQDVWKTKLPEGSNVFFVNGGFEVMVANPSNKIGALLPASDEVKTVHNDTRIVREGNEEYLYISTYTQIFDTRLLYQVPISSIVGEQQAFQIVLIIVMVIYFLIVALFIIFLLRSVFMPIGKLSRLTNKYEPGMTLVHDSSLLRKDEIGHLYEAFHMMTERVNQLVKERYTMELRQVEMELATLHSQVTPHLLYNTLDSIYWLAIREDARDLASMVKDLSSLLRIGLSKGKELITIEEEMQHIQAYVRLQLQRYQNVFHIHWEIDDAALPYQTPKVILQPIAENSIIHGIGKMDGEGELWIRINLEEGYLQLIVEDNGFKPVDVDRLNARVMDDTMGYGIKNVDRRIKLHYGEHYGIRYSSRTGGGTVASMVFPAKLGRKS